MNARALTEWFAHRTASVARTVLVTAALAAAVTGAQAGTVAARPAPGALCGAPTAADQPDAASAFQIHVLYAYPSDGPDRFLERTGPILNDLASIDEWWRTQDPTRTLRFDLSTAACDSSLGRLDLSEVRLPSTTAYYGEAATSFERIVRDLARPPLSFSSPDKKYLVYYDGPLESHHVCGTSPLGPARADGISVVFLDSACGSDLGRAGEAAATAVHELIHNLAAQPQLHGCSGTRSHSCDSANDILYWAVESGALLANLRLDVGHDDYYELAARAGSAWDVRNSPFLEHLDLQVHGSPVLPSGLSATSLGARVTLTWPAANGAVLYRLYRRGALAAEVAKLGATVRAGAGTTLSLTLRAASADGYLSVPQTIRFKVGVGLVDEKGALVRDTVPPARVTGLRVTRSATGVVLRWRGVTDACGLAGYRVFRDGVPLGRLVTGTAVKVGAGRASGTWTVAAVDKGGNTGESSKPLRFG